MKKETKTIAQQINWDFEVNGSLEILDKNGNRIYWENSGGYWAKWGCNSRGNEIYFQDSDGEIRDNRPKLCESKEIEIEGVKYKLVKI